MSRALSSNAINHPTTMSSSEEYQSSHHSESSEEEWDTPSKPKLGRGGKKIGGKTNKTAGRGRAKRAKASIRRNPRRYTTDEMNAEIDERSYRSDEDADGDGDESEEEVKKQKKPKRKSGYKKPPSAQKKRQKKKIASDSESDSDEDYGTSRGKKKGKKLATSESEDWDQESEQSSQRSESDESHGKTKKRPTPRKVKSSARIARPTRSATPSSRTRSHDHHSDEEIETTPSGRPARRCAATTQLKMNMAVTADKMSEREALGDVLEESEADMLDDGSASDSSIEAPKKNSPMGTPKKKNKYDEDEDYKDDGLFNDDGSSSSDASGEEYESEEEVNNRIRRTRSKPNYAEVNDVGTADEDSGDEDTGPSLLISPAKRNAEMPYGSPELRKQARAKRRPLSLQEEEIKPRAKSRNAESSDSSVDRDQTYFQHKQSKKISPSKLKTTTMCCPSKEDAITMMPLSPTKPHICFSSPDGTNRQCFTLETFYRIAISAYKENNGELQFLQPPHFRTPIEDDLLDQIASRFGRGALIIENSPLYKKMRGRNTFEGGDEMEEFDSDGEYVGPLGSGLSVSFGERFRRYVSGIMGSQDVYCCPLCYNEAYRRLGEDEEMIEDDSDEDESGTRDDKFSFLDDPMTILGSLDHQEFAVASSFCFRLLTGVKNHLRAVHNVDTKKISGNDLFKRFQIRAADGLLQSWLRKSLKKSMVQGDMMRYWNEGENQAFLLLLNKIDRGVLEGEQSGEIGSDFSLSFPNRARKIWKDVSSPFLKGQDDMKDFLADDDEDDGDSAAEVPINPHFTPPTNEAGQFKSPEEEMVEFLKRKNATRGVASSSEDENNDSDGSSSDSDELEVLSKEQVEVEEEEDDWTKSKQYKSKKQTRKRSRQNEDDSDDDEVFDANGVAPKTPLNGKSNHQIGSDDSDQEKPVAHGNGSARKRIADESSDEE